uniref:WD_REPEATS_REGION domain-containing protein n=1 Tax=Heterorhabditis bacteriophora TaxID=37862 RepID=A0A1I7WZM2_HETBA
MTDWTEGSVRGFSITNIAFNSNNMFLAACSGVNCIVYSIADSKSKFTLKHSDPLVAAFFTNFYELSTVTCNGEFVEWIISDDSYSKKSSRRVTAFPVRHVFWLPEEQRCVLLVERGEDKSVFDVSLLLPDRSLEKVATLPSSIKRDQIAVTDSFLAYCNGKQVSVIPMEDDSDIPRGSYVCKTHIKGIGTRNEDNIFVRIAAKGDTVAASLAIGRVYVWCVSRSSFYTGTRFDYLYEFSHIFVFDTSRIIYTEDNSLHIVLTSSMSVLCSLPTVTSCERSLKSIFITYVTSIVVAVFEDPRAGKTVVMNGKPGSLQWINPIDSKTANQINFSLENAVDGDMSFAGITHTYHDIEQAFMSMNWIITLETLVNFDEEYKRLRIWKRNNSNPFDIALVESSQVSGDTIFVTGCSHPNTDDENVFITCTSNGNIYLWQYLSQDTRWQSDSSRETQWQGSALRCCSSVQSGAVWASAHKGHPTDNIVLWDTTEMRVIDVIATDGVVCSVEWASSMSIIYGTNLSVSCWDVSNGTCNWVVEQSLKIVVNPIGCFAWDEDQVIEFERSSGRLLHSIRFASSITDLIVTKNCTLVGRTTKGLVYAHPPSIHVKKPATNVSEKTPFALLSAETSEQNETMVSGKSVISSVKPTSAVHMLDEKREYRKEAVMDQHYHRPRPSGLAGAVLDKQASKFNDEEAGYLLEWIKGIIHEDFSVVGNRENFREQLKDGQKLCK